MKRTLLISILSATWLQGCLPETVEPDNQNTPPEAGDDIRICSFSDGNGDELVAHKSANSAEEWLFIDSMSGASADIELDDDDLVGAFAVTSFIGPSLADAFSGLNVFYACTSDVYALNQCNWEQVDTENNETLKVETVLGGGDAYTTTVSLDVGDGFETQIVLDGVLTDLGNLTIMFYDNGVVDVTRTATRSSNGTETVTYASAETNWTATETAGCSGSIDFDSSEDGETVTLDASWSLSGTITSGSLEYFKTGLDSTYHLTW